MSRNPETQTVLNVDRIRYWLGVGAQPSETAAYLLNKTGVLPRYLDQRPEKKKDYKYLDKTTAAISKPSAVDVPAAKAASAEPAAAPAPAAVEAAPEAEAPAEQ